jgi:hypothetical protein
MGQLVANGRRKELYGEFVRMMDICAREQPIAAKRDGEAQKKYFAPGSEFAVKELVLAVAEAEKSGIFPKEKTDFWRAAFGAMKADDIYTVKPKPGDGVARNWTVFGAASEQVRIAYGMGGDASWVERYVSDQLRFFDENGMFSKQRLLEFVDYVSTDETGRLKMFWDYLQNTAVNQEYYAKYMSLFTQSNFVNSLMLSEQIADNNNTFNVEFVMVPFGFATDSTIVVSDKEIKEYYESHKKFFKQPATRDIEYVVFEVVPSQDDFTEANEALNEVYEEFATTDNVKSFLLFLDFGYRKCINAKEL